MKKDRVLLGWAMRLKTIRSQIRLKYSLMADKELNDVIQEESRKYFKAVQAGKEPAPLAIEQFSK